MAKVTKVLDSGRTVFTNLKYMYVTPWMKQEDGSYELGSDIYDLVNIVGDSTNVEQAENEVNEIEHEFSSEPLYEAVTLGTKTFATECVDYQNDVLKVLFGWKEEGGILAAPSDYEELYCAIELGFNSTDKVVVLPKVKMNSRAVLASMKTDVSRGNITGTAYSAWVKGGSGNAIKTDMFIIAGGAEGETATYTLSEVEPTE